MYNICGKLEDGMEILLCKFDNLKKLMSKQLSNLKKTTR